MRLTQPPLEFWFPEVDSISFRVHDLGKFPVVATFYLTINIDAFGFQLRQDFIQVFTCRLIIKGFVLGAK